MNFLTYAECFLNNRANTASAGVMQIDFCFESPPAPGFNASFFHEKKMRRFLLGLNMEKSLENLISKRRQGRSAKRVLWKTPAFHWLHI
ncbi:hypothetical protein [Dyadobacter sandarakinus]|uniref:Uncharacterized protein n=1 Tax=Dyadobacter sandarakinus TaxID=2747268 RepID=A0ABX7I4G7_9BACT|nr:hypothetical protein [Dyadobacter sandarakinus]QRR00984.1 hypothetical protein HWI92_08765 [Dyadobacter sandarakinus]